MTTAPQPAMPSPPGISPEMAQAFRDRLAAGLAPLVTAGPPHVDAERLQAVADQLTEQMRHMAEELRPAPEQMAAQLAATLPTWHGLLARQGRAGPAPAEEARRMRPHT